MTGGYLEMQINEYIIGPIMAFRKYIFSDVIPAFGNLDKRADDMANEYYNKIGAQPAWNDCDVDMAGAAEVRLRWPRTSRRITWRSWLPI